MIHKMAVQANNNSLVIDLQKPEESGFAIKSIEGLGPVKANINVGNFALSDGGRIVSSRLPTRNITIEMVFYEIFQPGSRALSASTYRTAIKRETVEDLRQKSYKYFGVQNTITLYFLTDNRYVAIEGIVESNEPIIFGKECGTKISVLCANPYFVDVGNDVGEIIFTSEDPEFHFDFANILSSSSDYNSKNYDETLKTLLMSMKNITTEIDFNYNGTTTSGVQIRLEFLSADSGDIEISNMTEGTSMTVDISKVETILGESIAIGDSIVIDTTFGNKNIYINHADRNWNILNALGRNCDWISLVPGSNRIIYNALNGPERISVSIMYRTLYNGI